MAYETVRLKREELYDQVWSRPLRDPAKEYGLSDVGLRKDLPKAQYTGPGPRLLGEAGCRQSSVASAAAFSWKR